MKKKNEKITINSDGSVAGMFLGLLIGLFVPNVALLLGASGDGIIFVSFVALLIGFLWCNDNLPEKRVDPTGGKIRASVDRDVNYVIDEEYGVGRTPNPFLGEAIVSSSGLDTLGGAGAQRLIIFGLDENGMEITEEIDLADAVEKHKNDEWNNYDGI
ncbi:hypothetical protein KAR91_43190 [Candidatus Pacearchaeota archaeon]|nr:hypothetical protein [Candidatus Pacearchaeota archaeon]